MAATIEEALELSKCIPIGCLKIPLHVTEGISTQVWDEFELQGWKFFTHQPRFNDNLPASARLPRELQEGLIKSSILSGFTKLWNYGGIQMSFGRILDADSGGRIRIYILPQDVNRSNFSHENDRGKLTKLLLSQLEYSSSYWNGETDASHQCHPASCSVSCESSDRSQEESRSTSDDTSLLSMFNNVPSPNPQPQLESDPDIREGMDCLLDSEVWGLDTELYPYQRRTAALMYQRERNPGRIVDPRYQSLLDQEGKPWYYDNVSGVALREPRFYDGVCGGILAEEMGTGKTLICLALILANKNVSTKAPEPFVAETRRPPGKRSLMDMAAATINKYSIAWKPQFDRSGLDYKNCVNVLLRPTNTAFYSIQNTLVEPRRSTRNVPRIVPPREVFLSWLTLIIVPNNLVTQWQNEITKHTSRLKILVLTEKQPIPPITVLLSYDLLLFSESRFEWIEKEHSSAGFDSRIYCPLEHIRFQRCIIDEGHKLGNRSRSWKSDLLRVLDRLEIAARWVVTGTPSRGLYGVEHPAETNKNNKNGTIRDISTAKQEREDLQKIGNITAKYLRVRPWANTKDEVGDNIADWNVYVMNSDQHSNGHNRKDCLKTTLNSLIIRHRLSDVSTLLPSVDEKIVLLDGSFQDKLSLNLFSMMIIFNSVQSQRTDMDYFFHPKQRKSLIQLVKNLRQACFFGGVFYSHDEIVKSLETAEEFLQKKAVPISAEDEDLLKQAISFGNLVLGNRLKDMSNRFHAMPLYLTNFPGGGGRSWSLDDEEADGQPICTDAGMIHALQKFLNPCIDAPTSLQLMIDSGRLDKQGIAERSQALVGVAEASGDSTGQTAQGSGLAGNTSLGDDYHSKPKSGTLEKAVTSLAAEGQGIDTDPEGHINIAEPLKETMIISTVSAKLSYLIDSIVKYQDKEQIIVFYDNDNIAYYLAGVLEILQIQHLIYARAGLSAERRAQYVATFTNNSKFRVLLMDITQAAFGLDMRSASRIYFISPVLNPQVQAQAIGRARRISQDKPVSVETLVLRNSIEEVIVNRRQEMSHAEHSRVKSILDDKLIYRWIINAKIIPMVAEEDGVAQTAMLKTPQFVFGRGFGREFHPDEGLVTARTEETPDGPRDIPFRAWKDRKRARSPELAIAGSVDRDGNADTGDVKERPAKRKVRVAFAE
ncbi:hypothetical protein M426DRAFT_195553 [Hypoxylon sp. CI-4A]|nr:hypothetical protein M426DRAFT_195553 [Hypoxylon sp. CI-4A]